MSDLNLGQLITTPQNRDAIHIAVAPVFAAETMEPGQHIQLNHEGKAWIAKPPPKPRRSLRQWLYDLFIA